MLVATDERPVAKGLPTILRPSSPCRPKVNQGSKPPSTAQKHAWRRAAKVPPDRQPIELPSKPECFFVPEGDERSEKVVGNFPACSRTGQPGSNKGESSEVCDGVPAESMDGIRTETVSESVKSSQRETCVAGSGLPTEKTTPAPSNHGPTTEETNLEDDGLFGGATIANIFVDSAVMQGRRPKQEDRHVKVPDFTKAARALKMPIDHFEQPCSFFAVYDGHQGHLCADFVAKSFHGRLLKKFTAHKGKDYWTDDRVCSAMSEACEELDNDFLSKFRTTPDGSTLVATFLTGHRLFTAWIGDSRALLCRESSQGGFVTVALTDDHRPSSKAEADRVRKAGGQVVNFDGAFRVAHEGFDEMIQEIRRAKAQGLGTIAKDPVALAVSRALGDRHFKSVTGKALLIPTPSVRCVKLNPQCKQIALMCDGITDVMKNEEVIFELAFVREPNDAAANVRAACGALVQEAYKRGSGDNLTIILVQLQWTDSKRSAGKRQLGDAGMQGTTKKLREGPSG